MQIVRFKTRKFGHILTAVARINEFLGRRVLRTHFRADKVYNQSRRYEFVVRDSRYLVFSMFDIWVAATARIDGVFIINKRR